MAWSLDQCGHEPIDEDVGQFGVCFEHVSPVPAVSVNLAGGFSVGGLVPAPGSILGFGVVHELLAGTGGSDIKQFHRVLSGRVFVIVREDE